MCSQLQGLVKSGARFLPLMFSVARDAECCPTITDMRLELDCFLGQLRRPARVAQTQVWAIAENHRQFRMRLGVKIGLQFDALLNGGNRLLVQAL